MEITKLVLIYNKWGFQSLKIKLFGPTRSNIIFPSFGPKSTHFQDTNNLSFGRVLTKWKLVNLIIKPQNPRKILSKIFFFQFILVFQFYIRIFSLFLVKLMRFKVQVSAGSNPSYVTKLITTYLNIFTSLELILLCNSLFCSKVFVLSNTALENWQAWVVNCFRLRYTWYIGSLRNSSDTWSLIWVRSSTAT